MKIVFVMPNMGGGGSERVVANLANYYVNNGYEVDILLFSGNDVAYELDSRIGVVTNGTRTNGNPFKRLERIRSMRRYFKQNEGCYIFAFSEMAAVFAVISASGVKHRLLVSERNDPRRIPGTQKVLRNWAYSKAEVMISQTPDVVRMFDKKIQSKAVVIPNPLSTDIPEPYEGTRTKRVVNAARLESQKNHALLIEAFASFGATHGEYTLEIYGKGSLESELKAKASDLGIEDKVIFKGFSSDLKNDIKDASMFVLSSDYEGISNSLVEALAMGMPTISTDCPVGGSRMFIEDGVNGLLTPVGDVKALTEAMCKVADDSDFASLIGNNSVSIKERCRLKKIAEDILKAAKI